MSDLQRVQTGLARFGKSNLSVQDTSANDQSVPAMVASLPWLQNENDPRFKLLDRIENMPADKKQAWDNLTAYAYGKQIAGLFPSQMAALWVFVVEHHTYRPSPKDFKKTVAEFIAKNSNLPEPGMSGKQTQAYAPFTLPVPDQLMIDGRTPDDAIKAARASMPWERNKSENETIQKEKTRQAELSEIDAPMTAEQKREADAYLLRMRNVYAANGYDYTPDGADDWPEIDADDPAIITGEQMEVEAGCL